MEGNTNVWWHRTQATAFGIALLLAIVFAAMSWWHASVVTEVVVTFDGSNGDEEPRDLSLDLDGERLPDYRLDAVFSGDSGLFGQRQRRLGVHMNQLVGEGLRYAVTDDLPRRRLQELILLESDDLRDDPITRVQAFDDRPSADGYTFEILSERSFNGGLHYFFDTPVGEAIAWGIGVGVLIFVLALLGPMLPI